jgi:hypothetical protein
LSDENTGFVKEVGRRTIIEKDRVRSLAGPCGICGGRRDTATGVSPRTLDFPCTIIPLTYEPKKLT